METQTLNKIDFKKYLLEKLPDSRQEELIFWKKGIPLPIDLVYRIFDQRGELIKSYLDHISTAYLYSEILKKENKNWIAEINLLPSISKQKSGSELKQLYKKYLIKSNVIGIAQELANNLNVVEYDFTFENFLFSICHEGRKYKRLYLPLKIKETIKDITLI